MKIPFKEKENFYQEYLDSDEWHLKRNQILERDNNECVLCGSKEKLNIHHITYERLGYENNEDLITLCEDCHREMHKYLDNKVYVRNKIFDLRTKYYQIIKAEIESLIANEFGKDFKNKKHKQIILYLKSFWGKSFRNLPTVPICISSQNIYCEMIKKGLLK